MRVSELLGETKTVELKGMPVTFAPFAYTFGDMETLTKLNESDPATWEQMRDVLSRVIVSWDLEDSEGAIPTTAEGMRRVPVGILGPLIELIGEATAPTEEEGKAYGVGSSTPPTDSIKPLEESPNGTGSSKQPDTSVSPPGSSPVSPSAG
jgi:hypothetical protein